jgi:hypothetical protein
LANRNRSGVRRLRAAGGTGVAVDNAGTREEAMSTLARNGGLWIVVGTGLGIAVGVAVGAASVGLALGLLGGIVAGCVANR